MNLTEQWKNGNLPCGHYYVIFDKNDTPEISRCVYKVITLSNPGVRDFEDFGVEKVLAPVPSYDELQQLNENAIKAAENALDTFNENTKLRGLLKECYPYINREFEKQTMAENYHKNEWQQSLKLMDEIDAAIGESEE